VARLETGRLPIRLEEFSLGALVAGLHASTFAGAARDGRLVILGLPADLPVLRTDRVKVKEIVQNLVDNALKHGEGRLVEVEVGLAPGRESLHITVRDAGPGIAADLLPHLFEPFRPGHGPGHGTGFGLYIVRCFTEALGGRVVARSQVGEGTAITVELPLTPPAR
jgi:signal transduction histidine kinase